MPNHPDLALSSAPLSLVKRTIVRELCAAFPGGLPAEDIVLAVYGKRPPACGFKSVQVQISVLRDKLYRYGWTIPQGCGGRGNHASYRLEEMPAAKGSV